MKWCLLTVVFCNVAFGEVQQTIVPSTLYKIIHVKDVNMESKVLATVNVDSLVECASQSKNRESSHGFVINGKSCEAMNLQWTEKADPGTGVDVYIDDSLDPIDSGWNEWGAWGSCSAPCEGGTQIRGRTCAEPQYGGVKICQGPTTLFQDCNPEACPSKHSSYLTDCCCRRYLPSRNHQV